ncbi:hypothetical protein B6U81_00290 [Thermoplasmatales archaeon ex4484_30]|nr:MAG: hypothetical protein B6U81_00290 [Thermoplasmatales archaeon ex4484_30]
MIRIESLSKTWGDFSLKNICLEVREGEYFIVLGPTGSGKTLLLELIAGFYYPDKGRIFLKDIDITHLPPKDRGIGFVYQDYMLFPNMNVRDNIAYGIRVKGLEKEVVKKVEKLANLLGISYLLDRYPSNLSGGEAQRVAIARALAIEPDVLLLDEPLSALDPNLRLEIRKELRKIHKKMRTTTIHVTHSREDAMMLGDKIAVMNEGKIIQVGDAQEIFRRPKSKFVAEFVGVENIFSGKAEREDGITLFHSEGITIQSSSNVIGDVHASIRPEDIILSLHKVESSARNCLKGRVTEIMDMGTIMRVMVDCGIPFAVNITRESCMEMGISIGKEVYLIFKAQNVNLFG